MRADTRVRRARQLRTASRGRWAGRYRHEDDLRSAETAEFRERRDSSHSQPRRRNVSVASSADPVTTTRSPAASNAAAIAWLCAAVVRLAGTAAPGCITTYGAVPTRAATSGSGSRTASRAPSSSGGKPAALASERLRSDSGKSPGTRCRRRAASPVVLQLRRSTAFGIRSTGRAQRVMVIGGLNRAARSAATTAEQSRRREYERRRVEPHQGA